MRGKFLVKVGLSTLASKCGSADCWARAVANRVNTKKQPGRNVVGLMDIVSLILSLLSFDQAAGTARLPDLELLIFEL